MIDEAEINAVIRKLKEALAISEFHFRDAVIELLEECHDRTDYSDFMEE